MGTQRRQQQQQGAQNKCRASFAFAIQRHRLCGSGAAATAAACRLLTHCTLRAELRPRGKGWSARATRAHLPANRFALTRALFASDPPYYRPINLLSRRPPPCAQIFTAFLLCDAKVAIASACKNFSPFQSEAVNCERPPIYMCF
jgi:hypothetical protein